MQKARSHPALRHRAPTACRLSVSGSISLPSKGYFSPFPHGTCSLSVVCVYLALEDGPPRFRQGSTCPAVLGYLTQVHAYFHLRGYYPLWLNFPDDSANKQHSLPQHTYCRSKTPQHPRSNGCVLDTPEVWAIPRSLAATQGISIDFFSSGY